MHRRFLKASNGQLVEQVQHNNHQLSFGGNSNLTAYIGHDGLMEFEVTVQYQKVKKKDKEAIILACFSKDYFSPEVQQTGAEPILWTTHLMAPEAYTLKAALDGWVNGETAKQIEERAAQAYHKYQKYGINGARNLFTSGF